MDKKKLADALNKALEDKGKKKFKQSVELIINACALFFGGKKLPELGKGLGEGLRGFKDGMKGLSNEDAAEARKKEAEEKAYQEAKQAAEIKAAAEAKVAAELKAQREREEVTRVATLQPAPKLHCDQHDREQSSHHSQGLPWRRPLAQRLRGQQDCRRRVE